MLIDESKMEVGCSVSFLNCEKQQTNLKLRRLHLRLKRKQNLFDQNVLLKLVAIDQFRSHTTAEGIHYLYISKIFTSKPF